MKDVDFEHGILRNDGSAKRRDANSGKRCERYSLSAVRVCFIACRPDYMDTSFATYEHDSRHDSRRICQTLRNRNDPIPTKMAENARLRLRLFVARFALHRKRATKIVDSIMYIS